MRLSKSLFFMFFCLLAAAFSLTAAQRSSSRATSTGYRENNCVKCHASLREPLGVSAHFFEWKASRHEKTGVGCEKCHGGDPKEAALPSAHTGVLRATFPQSRLSERNVSATCGSCHSAISNAFTNSAHGQRLNQTPGAPNCSTCHHHMATAVIGWPPQTSALCANCHNAAGGPAGPFLDVPAQAGDTIAAFSRADGVIEWAHYLLNQAAQKKMKVVSEEEKIRRYGKSLADAKIKWHEFNLRDSRQAADDVFVKATEIKDQLWKRLPN